MAGDRRAVCSIGRAADVEDWRVTLADGIALLLLRRAFLTRAYPTMKKNNPHTPILIREALGVEPKIWARYGASSFVSGVGIVNFPVGAV